MGRKGSTNNYGLRRRDMKSTIGDVQLMMECFEDALTPSQIEASKKAREEYRKAMKLIEAAKAGILSREQLALCTLPAAKPLNSTSSPDIIIVGETPPPPVAAPKQVPPPVVVPQLSPTQVQILQPHVLPGTVLPGAVITTGAVPQQVYRFVNYGQNTATVSGNRNQIVLRPLMPVLPHPQTQISVSGRMPSPRLPVNNTVITPFSPLNATIVSGTSGLGIKRPPDSDDIPPSPAPSSSPPAKRARKRLSEETDNSGNWVPLDEYYYGKMEGDPTYFEEKEEYRFKCWMCTKMLYNNIKAMMHLQGHIDSEKQQNLDLSDLTQCKHCYKQFDTPFEMQTHIEKVHMNNMNVLMCRICEKDHDSRVALTSHMRQNHCACEMPYVCQLCNFRSSMYSDVVDHFKKKHDSSESLLCLYCLRVFRVKFVSQGWGQTQAYYHHLLRHQSKTNNRKCTFCKLSFFNPQDLKSHRKTNHQPNQKGVIGASAKYSTPDQVMIKVPEAGLQPKKLGGCPKSLNAPAVSKVTEHRGLCLPHQATVSYCIECKMLMNTLDHYKKYIQCSMCRFATSCSFAYATHMIGFHSGQISSLSTNVPWERELPAPLYCLCSFSSKYGNKIANHLVFCSKRTCYMERPEITDKLGQDEQTDPRRKPDASILDVLGLVKKQTLPIATAEQGEMESDMDQKTDHSVEGRRISRNSLSSGTKEEYHEQTIKKEFPADDPDSMNSNHSRSSGSPASHQSAQLLQDDSEICSPLTSEVDKDSNETVEDQVDDTDIVKKENMQDLQQSGETTDDLNITESEEFSQVAENSVETKEDDDTHVTLADSEEVHDTISNDEALDEKLSLAENASGEQDNGVAVKIDLDSVEHNHLDFTDNGECSLAEPVHGTGPENRKLSVDGTHESISVAKQIDESALENDMEEVAKERSDRSISSDILTSPSSATSLRSENIQNMDEEISEIVQKYEGSKIKSAKEHEVSQMSSQSHPIPEMLSLEDNEASEELLSHVHTMSEKLSSQGESESDELFLQSQEEFEKPSSQSQEMSGELSQNEEVSEESSSQNQEVSENLTVESRETSEHLSSPSHEISDELSSQIYEASEGLSSQIYEASEGESSQSYVSQKCSSTSLESQSVESLGVSSTLQDSRNAADRVKESSSEHVHGSLGHRDNAGQFTEERKRKEEELREQESSPGDRPSQSSQDRDGTKRPHHKSGSDSHFSRDREHHHSKDSRDASNSRDRSHEHRRDHSRSSSDRHDRDYGRDYGRDRYDHGSDRHRQHDRHQDRHYDQSRDNHQGRHDDQNRHQQSRDRHRNRGDRGYHGYQDRSYNRGYY